MKRLALFLLLFTGACASAADPLLPGAQRIVFLGDSITYSGEYVDYFEAYLALTEPARKVELLDLGLPSETVSGLSEEGHADGKFPRPVLEERLARVLEKAKPDTVFACYGMNDGIYQPFDEGRFAKFKDGIEKLHQAVVAAGAKIILLTPPVYDPLPLKSTSDYDSVLTRYSQWLLEQRKRGWQVIDLHSPMAEALAERRKQDPNFSFAKDGVHPGDEGHRVLARTLLIGLGTRGLLPETATFTTLAAQIRGHERIMTDAWLAYCGHQRPGMAASKPLPEAQADAAKLEPEIANAAQAARNELK